jgi:hypothetical protein
MTRKITALAASAALLLTIGAGAVSASGLGPPHVAFFADGDLYRTVGTPTDFSATGAPAGSYDAIFVFADGATPVAEAKPGDRDYNGGRWRVYSVTWTDPMDAKQLTSAEEVAMYEGMGKLTIAATAVAFECPVIPIRGGR